MAGTRPPSLKRQLLPHPEQAWRWQSTAIGGRVIHWRHVGTTATSSEALDGQPLLQHRAKRWMGSPCCNIQRFLLLRAAACPAFEVIKEAAECRALEPQRFRVRRPKTDRELFTIAPGDERVGQAESPALRGRRCGDRADSASGLKTTHHLHRSLTWPVGRPQAVAIIGANNDASASLPQSSSQLSRMR